jgi:hypothetical protein
MPETAEVDSLEAITNPLIEKKSYGFKPGDLVRDDKRLYRYAGYLKEGIENTPYDREVLVFGAGHTIHQFDFQQPNLFYLVTKESSSQGFVDPKTVTLERGQFIDAKVKDLKKIGNIPSHLWEAMRKDAFWPKGLYPK